MRNCRKLTTFFALGFDKVSKKLLREYTAGSQIIVVCFQSVESGVKRSGQTLELLLFFFGEVVQIDVVRTPSVCMRVDLVDDTVETCHQESCITEVRVAGCVGVAELKAAEARSLRISGNTDNGTAVGSCITNGYGSFKTGNQTLEGVGAGVGDASARFGRSLFLYHFERNPNR